MGVPFDLKVHSGIGKYFDKLKCRNQPLAGFQKGTKAFEEK
jgi:hypothetical protein